MIGKAIIISAPSGSGKTTIVRHLLKVNPLLQFSISATTRKPRPLEVDGKDYYFLTAKDFLTKEFVEKEEVYEGFFYGTLKSEIERIWQNGRVVLFDVDVQGGVNLKEYFGDKALSIFIKVDSPEVIKERLIKRNTESTEDLKKRIDKASYEMSFEKDFDIVILNQNLDIAQKDAENAINKFIG
ncbi:MAG: guanylate kinase [Bacteroidetes bacterium]|nr:guanylate kinase [Bacteroidota bacterium]MDA1119085.1 guanylate kinase [Bacteroidota bacterium]